MHGCGRGRGTFDISTFLAKRSDGPMSMPVSGALPMPADPRLTIARPMPADPIPSPTASDARHGRFRVDALSGRIHKDEQQKVAKRC